MPTDILMPALSPTMTEGTLARWLKKEGDPVAPGDVIAEIETDKATMEVEAVDEGRIGRILVREGTEGVAVNTPIAVLLAEGEEAVTEAATAEAPPAGPQAKAGRERAAAPAAAPANPAPAPARSDRIFASPLARRIAEQNGISLEAIKGSGPNGRIVRADVEGAVKVPAPQTVTPQSVTLQSVTPQPAASRPAVSAASAAQSASAPTPVPAAASAPAPQPALPDAPHTAVKNSSMRRAIARRLSQSLTERPHFYVTVDIELDELQALRAKLNKRAPDGEGGFKLSVNDMLIKAAAIAHRRVPGVAVTYTEDAIIHWDNIDISVAVAIPDGLITPIVRDADRKGLVTISNEVKDLVARARTGKLKPAEFEGGAFSISNLGMFGVREFTGIINPPQAAILALGAGEKRPVVRHDELAIATVMSATMSSDHRAIDGALAARYLAAFKGIVQDPLELML